MADKPILSTDPLDIAVDPVTGDVVVDSKEGLKLTYGLAGVAQLIKIAVRLFLGEWFLNLAAGMPWYQEILGDKYDEQLLRLRLQQVILNVPGTIAIKQLVLTYDQATRGVNVSWIVTTVFGDTPKDSLDLTGGSANG